MVYSKYFKIYQSLHPWIFIILNFLNKILILNKNLSIILIKNIFKIFLNLRLIIFLNFNNHITEFILII